MDHSLMFESVGVNVGLLSISEFIETSYIAWTWSAIRLARDSDANGTPPMIFGHLKRNYFTAITLAGQGVVVYLYCFIAGEQCAPWWS